MNRYSGFGPASAKPVPEIPGRCAIDPEGSALAQPLARTTTEGSRITGSQVL
jgi:hypothetical protein